MKYRNKETGEIKEPKEYVEVYAITHNSNWEEYKEPVKKKDKKED